MNESETFESVYLWASHTRETKDPRLAISLFYSAMKLARSETHVLLATLQIGLCYEYILDYAQAEKQYSRVLADAMQSDNALVVMLAQRHQLSIMLHKKRLTKAIRLGLKIQHTLRSLPTLPVNAAWVTHGTCEALKAGGSPRDLVAKFAHREFQDLLYARKFGVGPICFKNWVRDWLSDMAYAHVLVGWVFRLAASSYSAVSDAQMRFRQYRLGVGK